MDSCQHDGRQDACWQCMVDTRTEITRLRDALAQVTAERDALRQRLSDQARGEPSEETILLRGRVEALRTERDEWEAQAWRLDRHVRHARFMARGWRRLLNLMRQGHEGRAHMIRWALNDTAERARADERAKVEGEVVAWLRAGIDGTAFAHIDKAMKNIADGIERGEHRPKGTT